MLSSETVVNLPHGGIDMRLTRIAALLAVTVGATACTSYVKTYDARSNLLGSCVARKGLLFGGRANCAGFANPNIQDLK